MRPAFSRRYRRRGATKKTENPFFKKEGGQESFFSGPEHDNFFQPAVTSQSSQAIQKSEEENVQRQAEKKEEEKVQKKEEKKEEEKVQKKEDKKEDEKVQKMGDKKEEEKVQKMGDKKEEEKVQKKETGVSSSGSKSLGNYIGSLNGKGQALPSQANEFFSSQMGYDFSDVKVHTDKEAAESAKDINAKAYTTGSNVVFNEGQYNVESTEGKKLMAHELTHVIQQDNKGNKQKNQ